MAFLLYERLIQNGAPTLRPTGEHFRLAGYNLIFQAWERCGKPINQGWHVSAGDLVAIHTGEAHSVETRRLIIDFHPGARWRVGLIELLDVYAFTYGHIAADGAVSTWWTPLMLRLRDIFYEEFDNDFTAEAKQAMIANLHEPESAEDFVEFLYLTGAWGWGRQGMTNAAFIKKPAREYFRTFF